MIVPPRKRIAAALALFIVIAAYAVWRVVEPAPFGEGRVEVVYSETSLGAKDPGYSGYGAVSSDDFRHVAYIAARGDKFVVVRDGVAGNLCDLITGAPAMTADGEHLAYAATRGGKSFAVLDGVEGPLFDEVHSCRIVEGPDGSRCAYVARSGAAWSVIIAPFDGGAQAKTDVPACDMVSELYVSPDGSRIACSIARQDGYWVYADGREFGPYDACPYPDSSPDGKHLWFIGKSGTQTHLLIDGVEMPDYAGDEDVVWSAAGGRYGYKAQRRDKQLFVIDGVEGKAYDRVWHLNFSPDGKHYVYAALTISPCRSFIVADGKEGPSYLGVQQPQFLRNGRLAYLASRDGAWFAVADGVEGKAYKEIGRLALAADGATVLYDVTNGDESAYVLGTLEGLAFSPDECGEGAPCLDALGRHDQSGRQAHGVPDGARLYSHGTFCDSSKLTVGQEHIHPGPFGILLCGSGPGSGAEM